MTEHATTDDLRAALDAALPTLTGDQARRARDLLVALAPPMEEPLWPGAAVIAGCYPSAVPTLHIRRNCGLESDWECEYCTVEWHRLAFPRPLTPAEYAEHRIPQPCTHGAGEEKTRRDEGTAP